MASISRRDAGKLLLAGSAGFLATPRKARGVDYINSVVSGVQIGSCTYSFRPLGLDGSLTSPFRLLTLDGILDGFQLVGLGECELWTSQVEPQGLNEQALNNWRFTMPPSYFHEVRQKFDRAGVLISAYSPLFPKGMSDAEIERAFQMTQALGVKTINSTANVSMAPRVDQFAQKFEIKVGFHNHDQSWDPDEFSTAETFERAMKGASKYIGVNLDIGHFVAAGGDPVEFIREHHDRITTLHIKDRKKNHGPNMPFGHGDTPIVAVLRLLRDNQWRIPANIEYEYGPRPDLDTVVEMKKCYAYCREALLTDTPNGPSPVEI
jgi:sugar phosphate isomerase/epimerase